jgi:chromatin modification-related protein VID21
MKTPIPSSEKLNGAEVSGGLSTTQDAQASSRDLDTDEDNDELDLIGSSAFSQKEHKRRHEIRPEIREMEKASLLEENGGALMSVKGVAVSFLDASAKTNASFCVETPRFVPHSLLLTDKANEVKVEGEELLLNRLELSKDKIDDMDVDEVEAITKPIVAEETEEDSKSSAALIKEFSGKPATPTIVQDSGLPEEGSLVTTASSSQAKVNTHINGQAILTPTSAINDEKLFQDIQKGEFTIETDGNKHFNPVYTLPPLSILPADFTRKAKPIKRKKDKEREGKRDRDDTVPMGLARWSATLMANPLWRKVSRAGKTLSTREWSVRSSQHHHCPQ